jgi:hypothetical protein
MSNETMRSLGGGGGIQEGGKGIKLSYMIPGEPSTNGSGEVGKLGEGKGKYDDGKLVGGSGKLAVPEAKPQDGTSRNDNDKGIVKISP